MHRLVFERRALVAQRVLTVFEFVAELVQFGDHDRLAPLRKRTLVPHRASEVIFRAQIKGSLYF